MINRYALIPALGSAALLLGAFGFQYLGDLPPCKLCIYQRYPHGAAVLIGLLMLALPWWGWRYLGALAATTTGIIGAYHAGVEQGWWDGPTTCTAGPIGGLSTDDLLGQIMAAPIVRCDEIPWEFIGLSMASWNAIISVGLAAAWMVFAKKS